MRSHPRRKTFDQSLLGGSHPPAQLPVQSNAAAHSLPNLESSVTLFPADRHGLFNVDQTAVRSGKQPLQPVVPRSQSLGPDPSRPASRPSRRSRRDTSLSSSLLIKAYLKNPVNPVPCPSLLKMYTSGAAEPSRASTSMGRPGLSSSPMKPSRPAAGRSSPPRLNGPFLRNRSEDGFDSRRVEGLFYGPVDPVLVDPTIDHPIYYTFPALKDALMAPNDCCECDLFDPVILHPSFTPLPPPSSANPSSLHLPFLTQNSALYPWDAKKGIGPLNYFQTTHPLQNTGTR